MKKRLLFCLIVGLIQLNAVQAQIGVKGGINLSAYHDENQAADFGKNAIVGAVAGLTVDLDMSEHFSLQPELLYLQKGGKSTFTLLSIRTEQINLVNYLEIPLLAKLRFGNNGKDSGAGFYVAAGPWAGFALSGKYKASSYDSKGEPFGDPYVEKYTFDDQDDRKRIDWGASGGLGLVVGKLILEGRFNYGINNLLDNDANNNNDNKPLLQTRGISLTLGIVL